MDFKLLRCKSTSGRCDARSGQRNKFSVCACRAHFHFNHIGSRKYLQQSSLSTSILVTMENISREKPLKLWMRLCWHWLRGCQRKTFWFWVIERNNKFFAVNSTCNIVRCAKAICAIQRSRCNFTLCQGRRAIALTHFVRRRIQCVCALDAHNSAEKSPREICVKKNTMERAIEKKMMNSVLSSLSACTRTRREHFAFVGVTIDVGAQSTELSRKLRVYWSFSNAHIERQILWMERKPKWNSNWISSEWENGVYRFRWNFIPIFCINKCEHRHPHATLPHPHPPSPPPPTMTTPCACQISFQTRMSPQRPPPHQLITTKNKFDFFFLLGRCFFLDDLTHR